MSSAANKIVELVPANAEPVEQPEEVAPSPAEVNKIGKRLKAAEKRQLQSQRIDDILKYGRYLRKSRALRSIAYSCISWGGDVSMYAAEKARKAIEDPKTPADIKCQLLKSLLVGYPEAMTRMAMVMMKLEEVGNGREFPKKLYPIMPRTIICPEEPEQPIEQVSKPAEQPAGSSQLESTKLDPPHESG